MDGIITITNQKLIKQIFILMLVYVIIHNQNNKSSYASYSVLYILLLTNLIGVSCLIKSNDWLLTIISWELLNLSTYLIISINPRNNESSLSTALKYLILSSLSTVFLLLGIYIIYKHIGNTNYDSILISLIYNKPGEYLSSASNLSLGIP